MNEIAIEDMTFEQAMLALEEIVAKLERGDVALEESISLYERGDKLKTRCAAKLQEAEEKVALITLDGDSQPKSATPLEGL